MTERNWLEVKQNLERESGKSNLNVCFPAALDAVSLKHNVPITVYRKTLKLYEEQFSFSFGRERKKFLLDFWHELYKQVGVRIQDIRDSDVNSSNELRNHLKFAEQKHLRVIIYWVSHDHVVGLLHTDNGWKIVGNDPLSNQIMSTESLYNFMSKHKSAKGTMPHLLLLPKE